MLAKIRSWLDQRAPAAINAPDQAADDAEALAVVRDLGGDQGAVVRTERDPRWDAAFDRLAARGLVELIDGPNGMVVRLFETPAAAKPRRGFNNKPNHVWQSWVDAYRRDHGRWPTGNEVHAKFPEMARATAYRYARSGRSSQRHLRLVKSA